MRKKANHFEPIFDPQVTPGNPTLAMWDRKRAKKGSFFPQVMPDLLGCSSRSLYAVSGLFCPLSMQKAFEIAHLDIINKLQSAPCRVRSMQSAECILSAVCSVCTECAMCKVQSAGSGCRVQCMPCTICKVQSGEAHCVMCREHTVQCAILSQQGVLHTQCAMRRVCNVQCAHCTLHIAHSAHCMLHFPAHCKPCTVLTNHCLRTVCTAQCAVHTFRICRPRTAHSAKCAGCAMRLDNASSAGRMVCREAVCAVCGMQCAECTMCNV